MYHNSSSETESSTTDPISNPSSISENNSGKSFSSKNSSSSSENYNSGEFVQPVPDNREYNFPYHDLAIDDKYKILNPKIDSPTKQFLQKKQK